MLSDAHARKLGGDVATRRSLTDTHAACVPLHSHGVDPSPAPVGAVLKAAQAGNVSALKAALDAGGSTEEATEVRRYGRM